MTGSLPDFQPSNWATNKLLFVNYGSCPNLSNTRGNEIYKKVVMRKIAILGFKGGIGKTTTCISLGAALALQGYRVLLIDTDTQANLPLSLGINGYEKSLADVLVGRARAEECILPARKNVDLLPSSPALFKVQQRMVLELAREEIFEQLFAGLDGYDYQLLDCAPSLSLLTINTIAYVDEVFVPVSMEMLALAGAEQFLSYLQEVSYALGGVPLCV